MTLVTHIDSTTSDTCNCGNRYLVYLARLGMEIVSNTSNDRENKLFSATCYIVYSVRWFIYFNHISMAYLKWFLEGQNPADMTSYRLGRLVRVWLMFVLC